MPRSPNRYDKDRRDRHNRPQKDYSGEVAKMKEKMRSNLDTARQGISDFSREKPQKYEELTPEEHLARTRAIEEIEEGGFQPGSYRTGSAPKKDQKTKKESSHDAAIFGPAWKSAEQRKAIDRLQSDISTISLPTAPPPAMNSMAPMVPSHMMSEHTEKRKAEWKTYWSDLRQQLLNENY